MKTAIFAAVCALVGVLLGSGLARLEMGEPANFALPGTRTSDESDAAEATNLPPQVTVDSENFDFGTMERGTRKSHQFIFTNTGGSPLTLSVGDTTCKCTLGQTPDRPIPPGESVPVKLEWTANTGESQFRQSATIHTNDPFRPTVNLSIVGMVADASTYHPRTLLFGNFPSGTTRSAELHVVSYKDADFEILDYEIFPPSKAAHFEVEIEELPESDYPSPDVQSGRKIKVITRPSLPFGTIGGWIKVRTSLETSPEFDVPLAGKVVSDISIFGRNYDNRQDRLDLGAVLGSDGKEHQLLIMLRGDQAADVEFAVDSTFPDFLQAELGERKPVGNVTQVPLTIRVPRGAPSAVHLGGRDSEAGRVVLRTTHPQVPTMPIEVRFTVE